MKKTDRKFIQPMGDELSARAKIWLKQGFPIIPNATARIARADCRSGYDDNEKVVCSRYSGSGIAAQIRPVIQVQGRTK